MYQPPNSLNTSLIPFERAVTPIRPNKLSQVRLWTISNPGFFDIKSLVELSSKDQKHGRESPSCPVCILAERLEHPIAHHHSYLYSRPSRGDYAVHQCDQGSPVPAARVILHLSPKTPETYLELHQCSSRKMKTRTIRLVNHQEESGEWHKHTMLFTVQLRKQVQVVMKALMISGRPARATSNSTGGKYGRDGKRK
jgi:hypothetical protein